VESTSVKPAAVSTSTMSAATVRSKFNVLCGGLRKGSLPLKGHCAARTYHRVSCKCGCVVTCSRRAVSAEHCRHGQCYCCQDCSCHWSAPCLWAVIPVVDVIRRGRAGVYRLNSKAFVPPTQVLSH
jgi:hypothetical protein